MSELKKNQPPVVFLELENYVAPKIVEAPGTTWVSYGEDNQYFQYILDRYRGSPTNHAIINAIADQIVGGGLTSQFAARRPEAYAATRLLFPYDNLHRWAFDLKCYAWYMQIIVMKDDLSEIESVDYSPVYNWRSGKAGEDGQVGTFYYSDDWQQYRKKEYKPRAVPVYDPEEPVLTSCLPVMPYRTGTFYYPTVDYQGALQYAHIEEEISNFHLNNIKNGLAPGMLINFNNGDPGVEEREAMESKINQKWGGSSNAGRFVLAFNDSKDAAATIESVEVNDLDKQYQFLSTESTQKIMVGHRVTSPYFFGIRDGSGLGSNAEEIKNAWLLWERTVLWPYQRIMLDNINYLLNQMGVTIPMEFEPLTPIEFTDGTEQEPVEKVEQQKVDLKSLKPNTELAAFMAKGVKVDAQEWELLDERAVNYDTDETWNSFVMNLASVIQPSGSGSDSQDTPLFLVRYGYAAPAQSGAEYASREFCELMMGADLSYTKEDIQGAGAVNPGWGPGGKDTYDIWLYKGGGSCQHIWMRRIFLRKDNQQITVNEARRRLLELPVDERDENRFKANDKKVATPPRHMPKRGFIKPRKFTTNP